MPSKTGDNELPVFRWSVLKKYVDMPLFLNVQRHSGNSLLEHVLYSLIAAVAMSLALTVTLLWEGAGSLSAPIFVIAVFAYICRERIKDVLKHKLFKVFGKWIPDRVLRVCDGYGGVWGIAPSSSGSRIGTSSPRKCASCGTGRISWTS